VSFRVINNFFVGSLGSVIGYNGGVDHWTLCSTWEN